MNISRRPDTITLTPKSLSWDSTDKNWEEPADGTPVSIRCLVAPLDSDDEMVVLGEFGKEVFRVYCEKDESVAMGDWVTWDSNEYEVINEPQKYRNPTDWSDSHQEFLIQRHRAPSP